MSAITERILSLESVVDHDCGNYYIGEVDFRVHGTLSKYLKDHGAEGRDRILIALSKLHAVVFEEYRRTMEDAAMEQCASGKVN